MPGELPPRKPDVVPQGIEKHGQAYGKPCADSLSWWYSDRRVFASVRRVMTVRMRTAPSLDWDGVTNDGGG